MIIDSIYYQSLLTDRIKNAPRSFIREILKTAISPDVISFAGGLPNSKLFPVSDFQKATNKAYEKYGVSLFQYSNTEGFLPLREWISKRYFEKNGWKIDSKNILITNGSQQGLDLLGKILINEKDEVLIEQPGYLGAIQSLAVQGARFISVPMDDEGVNLDIFELKYFQSNSKLFYCVPAFQNPTGVLYSSEKIVQLSDIIRDRNMIVVEDTPYNDISFTQHAIPSFYNHIPDQTIILGSFSKTTVPGMRIGWIVAPDVLMDRLIVAKQAADLHTDISSQMIIYEYLTMGGNDKHIQHICDVYSSQCNAMVKAINEFFPEEVRFVVPKGGMFLWINMPKSVSSLKLFHDTLAQKVAFVPGVPFYADGRNDASTMRLNFSCSDKETIREGIQRMGSVLEKMLNQE
ncbi:MAG: PLP-dependent aminotransferase family protein [Marinilabiliaceae bacterium]|nr:PLP-dependent aminotransferase family protein [Marinilabiliaceae bacterium]